MGEAPLRAIPGTPWSRTMVLAIVVFVLAMAAWEASDSTSRWSSSEKGTTSPLSGSWALISCSTPITSSRWFFIGTVRNDFEERITGVGEIVGELDDTNSLTFGVEWSEVQGFSTVTHKTEFFREDDTL